jgi:hypothetical protein
MPMLHLFCFGRAMLNAILVEDSYRSITDSSSTGSNHCNRLPEAVVDGTRSEILPTGMLIGQGTGDVRPDVINPVVYWKGDRAVDPRPFLPRW